MNRFTQKFISILCLIVFFLASGPGQLIHAAFHDHNYVSEARKSSSVINFSHTYCAALQLTLPEFFESAVLVIDYSEISKEHFFARAEPAVPYLFLFKNSDRAPPVLA